MHQHFARAISSRQESASAIEVVKYCGRLLTSITTIAVRRSKKKLESVRLPAARIASVLAMSASEDGQCPASILPSLLNDPDTLVFESELRQGERASTLEQLAKFQER